MKSGRKGREYVLQSLYAAEIGGDTGDSVGVDKGNFIQVDEESRLFARHLIKATLDNLSEIDALIAQNAHNWDFNRISIMDKLILRFCVAEFAFLKSAPPKVCITEAVQIANKYSDSESPGFINGVLDAIYNKLFLTSKKA